MKQALWYLRDFGFSILDLSLEHTLDEESKRWIWVDVLCIDQSSTEEKNHQVRLMGEIYHSAVEVFAWLGTRADLPFGSRGRSAMLELAEVAADDYWEDRITRRISNGQSGLLDFYGLFNNQYWQRMWILQEIRLASSITLVFEDLAVSWDGIERIQKVLSSTKEYRETYLKSLRESISGAIEQRRYDQIILCQALRLAHHRIEPGSNTLEELLETGMNSLCADPRDKLYAILGLAVDCQNEAIAD